MTQIGWVKEKGNRFVNIESHPTPSSVEGKRLPDDGRSLVNGKLCYREDIGRRANGKSTGMRGTHPYGHPFAVSINHEK